MPSSPEQKFQRIAIVATVLTTICAVTAFLLPRLFADPEDPLGSAALIGLSFFGSIGLAALIAVRMSRYTAQLGELSESDKRLGQLPLYILATAMIIFALVMLVRMIFD